MKYYKQPHKFIDVKLTYKIYKTEGNEAWYYDKKNHKWRLCYSFDGMSTLTYAEYMKLNIEEYKEITEAEAFIEIL